MSSSNTLAGDAGSITRVAGIEVDDAVEIAEQADA